MTTQTRALFRLFCLQVYWRQNVHVLKMLRACALQIQNKKGKKIVKRNDLILKKSEKNTYRSRMKIIQDINFNRCEMWILKRAYNTEENAGGIVRKLKTVSWTQSFLINYPGSKVREVEISNLTVKKQFDRPNFETWEAKAAAAPLLLG